MGSACKSLFSVSNKTMHLTFPNLLVALVQLAAVLVLTVPLLTCATEQPPHPVNSDGHNFPSSHHHHHELPSTSTNKYHSRPKIKICADEGPSWNLTSDEIKIPTFFTNELAYELQEYEIDQKNPLNTCPTGEKPYPSHVTIVRKIDYDEEYFEAEAGNSTESFVFGILREGCFLFDNGHLSVGNDSTKTAHYFASNEFCLSGMKDDGQETTFDFRTCPVSKTRPILRKCCPLGMILFDSTCIGQAKGDKLDPGYMDAKTWKTLPIEGVDPVITSPILPCGEDFYEFWETDNCTYEFHPVTDNTVAFIGAYRTWEFFNSSVDWCIDMMQSENKSERMIMFQCVGNETSKEMEGKTQARISLLYMVNMYIGAIFHFMTTLVYLITWTKQNIHGKTLCSLTASLFFMQIFLGTAHLLGRIQNQRQTVLCVGNSIGGQYFMIAAFTWLLVVNYDLWRTFRSIRTEGGKSFKRFLAYSSFGWLFPSLVTAISVILDFKFQCRLSRVPVPEYGEYYCFVAPWAQGLYVYYILGILFIIICVLSVLTLFGLYSFKKDTVNLRSNKRADQKQNVLLFLKLSVVMGLTWIFEVISWAATKENDNHIGWIILDLYNALSAILIFLIFVCKRTTLKLLEEAVPFLKGITAALSKLSSTFSGDSSTDNNTSSTTGGHGHKKSLDSQGAATVVRYTKRGEANNGNGSTNHAFAGH